MFWIPLTDITATMNEHHCFLNPLGCEHLNFISVKTMILFIYNILPGQFCIRIPHQHTKSYCLFYSPGIPIWKESTTIEILLIAFFDNWRETPLYNTESEISENAESSFASKFKPIPHFFLSPIFVSSGFSSSKYWFPKKLWILTCNRIIDSFIFVCIICEPI